MRRKRMSTGSASSFRTGVTDRVMRRKRSVQSPVVCVIFSIGFAPKPAPHVVMSKGVEPKNPQSRQPRGASAATKTTTLIQRIMENPLPVRGDGFGTRDARAGSNTSETAIAAGPNRRPLATNSSQLFLHHGPGIAHFRQRQHLIGREVINRRHRQHTIEFLVGVDFVNPGSAVASHNVIPALQLAFLLQSLAILRLLGDGANYFGAQTRNIEMPEHEKFHEFSPPVAKRP